MATDGTWYTDANGREMQERKLVVGCDDTYVNKAILSEMDPFQ